MRKALSILGFLIVACSRRESSQAPPPAERIVERVVYVVATATPVPARVEIVEPTAIPFETAVPLPSPRPTPPRIMALVPSSPRLVPTEAAWVQIRNFVVNPPNSIGSVYYSGDVHNNTSRPVRVQIVARAYTINGALITSESCYTHPSPIPAGADAHFEYFIRDTSGRIERIEPEAVPQD
jgi:hypothetical protein